MRHYARDAMFVAGIAALSVLGACQRSGEESAKSAPTDAASAPAPAPAPATLPSTPGDEGPPEGVLRAYVWDCDGDVTLRVRNLYRENAVSIELHEGARKLPLVVSASGAKYADGTVTFWSKGGTATFERKGSPAINCTEARARSLLADAKLRGITYRAQGNEPGWLVEVGPGESLTYLADYGQERHAFAGVTRSSGDVPGTVVFAGEHGGQAIRVTLAHEACVDDMSGAQFDHRAVVEFGGQELRGCGTAVQ